MKQQIMNRFSNQIILILVAAIFITTLAAGLPAYWLLRNELQQQALTSLANGVNVTSELLQYDKNRIADLTLHASQRPTLLRLLAEESRVELETYLSDFLAGVDVDFIEIVSSCGQALAQSPVGLQYHYEQFPSQGTIVAILEGSTQLAIVATQPIQSQIDECQPYITLGILIDEGYIKQLAEKSGFEYRILFDHSSVLSSLTGALVNSTNLSQVDGQVLESSNPMTITVGETRYYTAILPLRDQQQETLAELQVLQSIQDLSKANQRAILTLIFSTLLVILLISVLGVYFTRRLTGPLDELTEAALNVSQGDLITPIAIPSSPYEVSALSGAFEESRLKIVDTLDNLSQAKNRMDVIIQSISDGILTTDENFLITSFNKAAELITGWERTEALGQFLNSVLPFQSNYEKLTDTISMNGNIHLVKILDRNGRPKILRITAMNLEDREQSTEKTLLTFHDATEEEATRQIRAYFIANISHEFRTPLSALNASVELILDEISEMSRAEIEELLNSIHYSVAALQTLIDNLLESTSIEAGHFRIRWRKTDLNNVIAEAIRVIDPLLKRRHQKLFVLEPEKLPNISIDPTRITQVLVNLLSNASKYSPIEEVIELRIELVEESQLHFSVVDRGPGITEQDRQNLFQRFVRLGEKDGAQYGVGLGLFVVKTIVEEHGGQVGVDNLQSGGSVFWFTLPVEGKKL